MIDDLEAIGRRRALSAQETDLLAELLRRAAIRDWQRKRRRSQQRDRAFARFLQLGGEATA